MSEHAGSGPSRPTEPHTASGGHPPESLPAGKPARHKGTRLQTAARRAMVVQRALEGAPPARIASELGVSPAIVHCDLATPTVQRLMLAELDRAGLTPRRLADKLVELLDARQVRFAPDGQGGAIERLVPDNATQLRAAELGFRLYERLTGGAPDERSAAVEAARASLADATIEELQLIAVRRRSRQPGSGGAAAAEQG